LALAIHHQQQPLRSFVCLFAESKGWVFGCYFSTTEEKVRGKTQGLDLEDERKRNGEKSTGVLFCAVGLLCT
jgi:hypothetical protein